MKPIPQRALENVKSVMLTLLVVMSISLSVIEWNGTPGEVSVGSSHFFSSPLYGHERLMTDFINPNAIWIWTKGNELFRLGGKTATAKQILSQLQSAQIHTQGFVHNSPVTLPPAHGAYLALDYGTRLSDGSIWSYALPIANKTEHLSAQGGSLYLVQGPKSNVWSLEFQTAQGIYQMQLSHVSSNLKDALIPNNQSVPYAQLPFENQVFNLPYDAVSMLTQTWILASPLPIPIINSFFRDPSLVQTVQMSRNETAYTDGTHTVQLTRHSMGFKLSYNAPEVLLKHYHVSVREALSAAIPFVDSHGGFVGQVVLQQVNTTSGTGNVQLQFGDELNGWPVFSQLNQIQLDLINGSVTKMQRLLPYLQSEVAQERVTILSGAKLLQIIKSMHVQGVQSIMLGYGSTLQTLNEVQLVPVYQVVANNRVIYLDAQTGQPFQGMGM